jgi:hypothetical protein
MHSVGGLWVIGFDIADVLFVPGAIPLPIQPAKPEWYLQLET